MASGGGVLRGHRGDWIKGFTEHFGTCTSIKAKLRAMLRGLKMARELGLRKVLLRADFMIFVGMLRATGNWNLIHKPLITQCKQLIEKEDWKSRSHTATERLIRLKTSWQI